MYNDLYGTTYSTDSWASITAASSTMGALFLGMMIFSFILSLIIIISYWKIFKKANKPGWAAIVPIYNSIVMIEIAGLPMWYIVLYLIPIANIYAMFKVNIEIAKKFGKSSGFGIGMALLSIIFVPMLAFSDNIYGGSEENNNTAPNNTFDATNNMNNGPIDNINVNQDNISLNNIAIEPAPIIEPSINVNPVENIVDNNPSINPLDNIPTENNIEPAPIIEPSINVNPVENIVVDNNPVLNSADVNTTFPIENVQEINNNIAPEINVQTIEPTIAPTPQEQIVVENPVIEPTITLQEQTSTTPNAFNSTPTPTEPIINNISQPMTVLANEPQNIINNQNVTNEMNVEINTQPAQDIPITNVVVDNVEQKKVCKNCGTELPSIVSICPNCGTDNE